MKTIEKASNTKVVTTDPVIAKAVAEHQAKVKQAEIDAEIRNRILDEQRKQPGHRYY